jgi:TPP-dependent pyruvate/acetoin dehydrogenase alpha subunit
MNFAAVRRLPLIVVIENNGFAYSTPGARQTRQGDFTVRGTAYGCAGVGVDGNDAAQLHDAVREAAARARAGGGPTVIEARTFRLVGHAEHDDASYLPPELVKEWKDKDPIRRIEERLVAGGFATRAGLEDTAARIGKSLDEDLAWAESCPAPVPESALGGLFAGEPPVAAAPWHAMGRSAAGGSRPPTTAKPGVTPGEPDGGPSWGVR